MTNIQKALVCVLFLLCMQRWSVAFAQQANSGPITGAGTTEDLQKASQNPVASMISVPIQNNSNFGIGPYDRIQNVLNIQPVIPVTISQNWNLIVRWIVPIVWQPAPGTTNLEVYGIVSNTPAYFAAQNVQKNAGVFGFGDMNPTFSSPHPNRTRLFGGWGQPSWSPRQTVRF